MSDIDGLATYPELPATGHAEVDGISIVSVNCMMAMLKLPNLTWHIQVGTVNIGGAVQQAVNALLAGVCKYAVVWRAMHNPRGTYQNLPGGMAAGAAQFTAPYGFGGPGQGMAVAYTRWLERHNQNREKMATLAVTQRRHTQHNPHAYFYGTPLSREDYLASRMVAYPFCLFDCDIPVQGAVAIVLTTADRARDLKPQPAYLAGYGQRLHFEVAGRIGSLADYMEGGRSSAKLTWERSGFGPKDVDVAQIYDGFSASVIYGLESYGFCDEGEALDFIQDGRIELDGELPLNTFGGSLGTGRIHGLWHIIEGALQASGRAGSRQVKDANVSLRRRQRPDRHRHDLHLCAASRIDCKLASRDAGAVVIGVPDRQRFGRCRSNWRAANGRNAERAAHHRADRARRCNSPARRRSPRRSSRPDTGFE